ncbi:hypothetical protein DFS34DRAFT_590151 [Phlyctochytrium arcticum]|nr:hypothetical protein DFS34DRAFT_590151 [Phlyctochytrium arcticum]
MSGQNMLDYSYATKGTCKATAPVCHSDAPPTANIQYASRNGSTITMTRASCYPDVAFYYNDAFLARPKAEHAWLEPWVRKAWGHNVKHFGGCAVPRGANCENFGAPKPLVLFLFLTNNTSHMWSSTRFSQVDGAKRNFIKLESPSFAQDGLDGGEHGGFGPAWIKEYDRSRIGCFVRDDDARGSGFSHFPLYDFYDKIGEVVSRDRWFDRRNAKFVGTPPAPWFSFFHNLWLETGRDLRFLTQFWNLYSIHYPKSHSPSRQEWGQGGNLNIGEAIHFLSAAVGRNLTTVAASRFTTHWKPETYDAAVAKYPALLTYESL